MSNSHTNLSAVDIARLSDRIEKPIVLVGLMGAGKTTVGRRLAAMLERDFVDADEEIERASQMTVAEMFDQFGEEYFRDGERRVVARLLDEGHGVIATGGGAFCQEPTRKAILGRSIAVWLDSDIDTLVERTARKNTRPLLENGDPEAILRNLYAERAPLYAMAHICVTTGQAPHDATAKQVLEAIERWL